MRYRELLLADWDKLTWRTKLDWLWFGQPTRLVAKHGWGLRRLIFWTSEERLGALENLAAFTQFRPALTVSDQTEKVHGALVTQDFFSVLGVQPAVGRNFSTTDAESGQRAGRRDVFWLILREALFLVIAGVAVGLPMIFAVTRLDSTLLFGLSPTDPVSLLFAALLMLTVRCAASSSIAKCGVRNAECRKSELEATSFVDCIHWRYRATPIALRLATGVGSRVALS